MRKRSRTLSGMWQVMALRKLMNQTHTWWMRFVLGPFRRPLQKRVDTPPTSTTSVSLNAFLARVEHTFSFSECTLHIPFICVIFMHSRLRLYASLHTGTEGRGHCMGQMHCISPFSLTFVAWRLRTVSRGFNSWSYQKCLDLDIILRDFRQQN
jgi:hypothetical protein